MGAAGYIRHEGREQIKVEPGLSSDVDANPGLGLFYQTEHAAQAPNGTRRPSQDMALSPALRATSGHLLSR
ncbi:hypothetical protein NPX13_g5047 [Xylaria arbuscula]|uniref:Uncharacterized protein n=1 Tax=Xylaria arbuscula TaxID=114810 RepID=A0A9W8NF83_9PEZI|nr:hypothetical protein NPX13_g5047 [Xylaria arbuscula]